MSLTVEALIVELMKYDQQLEVYISYDVCVFKQIEFVTQSDVDGVKTVEIIGV